MITVSSIAPRLDDLNNKTTEVNNFLELMCKQRSIPSLLQCGSIGLKKHLNKVIFISHCVQNVQIRSFFLSVFGHFLRSVNYGVRAFAEKFSSFLLMSNWHQQNAHLTNYCLNKNCRPGLINRKTKIRVAGLRSFIF